LLRQPQQLLPSRIGSNPQRQLTALFGGKRKHL